MEEPNCMLDVLKMKFPDMPIEKNAMVVMEDYLINSPLDWMDFVMLTVHRQRHDEHCYVICLEDAETAQAFEILTTDMIPVYVFGHPTLRSASGEKPIWMVWAQKHKEGDEDHTRIWAGGEHLRMFCDHHNLYYRTTKMPEGPLLSVSDCYTLKNPDDDCRKIIPIEHGAA